MGDLAGAPVGYDATSRGAVRDDVCRAASSVNLRQPKSSAPLDLPCSIGLLHLPSLMVAPDTRIVDSNRMAVPASEKGVNSELEFPSVLTLSSSASAESGSDEAQRTGRTTVAVSLKTRGYSLGSVVPLNSDLTVPRKKASEDEMSAPAN